MLDARDGAFESGDCLVDFVFLLLVFEQLLLELIFACDYEAPL